MSQALNPPPTVGVLPLFAPLKLRKQREKFVVATYK